MFNFLNSKETYSFNVQANFFDFNKNKENKENDSTSTTSQPETNNVEPETIYSNEVTSSNRNVATDENSVQNANSQYDEHKSKADATDQELREKSEKKGRRRGVWKRVRVRPVDSFEAAESQNIGKQIYNTIISENIKEFGERNTKKSIGTGIISSPSAYAYEETIDFNEDHDSRDREIRDDEPEVQTVLPIQTTESTKMDEFDLTTISDDEPIELTTEPIEKDERELEATSTINYNDADDFVTTVMPFISSMDLTSDLESLEKSTEQPRINLSTADDKNIKANVSDQIPESSSIIDEVKQKLTELFSFDDDDVVVSTTEHVFKFNRNFKRPKATIPHYTSIERNPLVNDIANNEKDGDLGAKSSPASMKLEPVEPVPVMKTILRPITEPSSFHKDLMDSVIYATSTSTEISHETEICYRGRCVKSQKKP